MGRSDARWSRRRLLPRGVVHVWTRTVLGLGPGMLFEAQNASSHRYLVSRKGARGLRSLNEVAYLDGAE